MPAATNASRNAATLAREVLLPSPMTADSLNGVSRAMRPRVSPNDGASATPVIAVR